MNKTTITVLKDTRDNLMKIKIACKAKDLNEIIAMLVKTYKKRAGAINSKPASNSK